MPRPPSCGPLAAAVSRRRSAEGRRAGRLSRSGAVGRGGPCPGALDRLIGFLGGQDHGRHLDQLAVALAGKPLQAAKGFVLVQARVLHEQSLGPLDELSILEGLAQIGCLLTKSLELLEPPGRDGDGRLQVGLLDRLDQERQDVVFPGVLDQVAIVIGRHQDHRDRDVLADLAGGVDAVHVGHLDVGDDEVGTLLAALLDQLATRACDGHHEMPEAGQDRLQIVPHVELIVGHGDPEVTVHQFRGRRLPR